MANTLDRDIKENEKIIVKKSVLKPEYQKLSSRVFVCQSGFGMSNELAGRTIYGYWLDKPEDNEIMPMMISGYEIDVEETKKYQEHNG